MGCQRTCKQVGVSYKEWLVRGITIHSEDQRRSKIFTLSYPVTQCYMIGKIFNIIDIKVILWLCVILP